MTYPVLLDAKCECEHADHFEIGASDRTDGALHRYGSRAPVLTRAGMGLHVCNDCLKAGHAPAQEAK